MIALSFFELLEKTALGMCTSSILVTWSALQDGLYAGQAGSLENFFIRHVVWPSDAKVCLFVFDCLLIDDNNLMET